MKTFCFDKTGTLTKPEVQVRSILKINTSKPQKMFIDISDSLFNDQNSLCWKIFATCHTTKIYNGEILGDEIDREMFVYSGAEMTKNEDKNIRFSVMSPESSIKKGFSKQNLHVLRINQF